MIYINKNAKTPYVDLMFTLDPTTYTVGTTYEDYENGLWVLLSDGQIAFKDANPTASVSEVFNMQLEEAEQPSDEELLSTAKSAKLAEASQYHAEKLKEITYNGATVYLDSYSRLLKEREATAALNAGESVVDLNGLAFPIEYIEQVMDSIAEYENLCAACISNKIAQIEACGTAELVEALTIGEGYPPSLELTDEILEAKKTTAEENNVEKQLLKFAKYIINSVSLTDEQAESVKLLYPEVSGVVGETLEVGDKVLSDGVLYTVTEDSVTISEGILEGSSVLTPITTKE